MKTIVKFDPSLKKLALEWHLYCIVFYSLLMENRKLTSTHFYLAIILY